MEEPRDFDDAIAFVCQCSTEGCSREWTHEGARGQDPFRNETWTYLETAQRETRTRSSRQ